MTPYLALLRDVLENGVRKPTRAVLPSTGQKVDALSVFGRQIRFDLSQGFPAVTTKRLAFGPVVHELIWFLRGSTNIAYLREQKVTIWDEWADEEGNLGPVYGKQWRSWTAPDGSSVDQIANLLRGIEAVKADPTASVGRRLIVSAWNPGRPAEDGSAPMPHAVPVLDYRRPAFVPALPAIGRPLPGSPLQYRQLCVIDASRGARHRPRSRRLRPHVRRCPHLYESSRPGPRAARGEPYPLPRLRIDPAAEAVGRGPTRADRAGRISSSSDPAGEVAV